MSSIREIGRKARRDLHREMSVAGLFIASTGAAPVDVTCRVHTKFKPTEAFGGGPNGMATMQDMQPKLIFMRDEFAEKGLKLARNAVVTIQVGEGYRVDNVEAPDDITVAAIVVRLSEREMQGLPVPGDSGG